MCGKVVQMECCTAGREACVTVFFQICNLLLGLSCLTFWNPHESWLTDCAELRLDWKPIFQDRSHEVSAIGDVGSLILDFQTSSFEILKKNIVPKRQFTRSLFELRVSGTPISQFNPNSIGTAKLLCCQRFNWGNNCDSNLWRKSRDATEMWFGQNFSRKYG